MKRVKVTLGHRQAALLWAAASRGVFELQADEDLEPDDYRVGVAASKALDALTYAMYEADFDWTQIP
jgi:hypothetical protein